MNIKRRLELTGQRFGKLVVEARAGKDTHGNLLWRCLCDCGSRTVVSATRLKLGKAKGCGCSLKKHGMFGHEIYNAYQSARKRCECETAANYPLYGGRGIEFRLPPFPEFLAQMGASWKKGLSLDRIDNAGHYELGNIRWTDNKTQSRNKRTNHLVTVNGITAPLVAFVEQSAVCYQTIYARLRRGWPIEDALTAKPDRSVKHERYSRNSDKTHS